MAASSPLDFGTTAAARPADLASAAAGSTPPARSRPPPRPTRPSIPRVVPVNAQENTISRDEKTARWAPSLKGRILAAGLIGGGYVQRGDDSVVVPALKDFSEYAVGQLRAHPGVGAHLQKVGELGLSERFHSLELLESLLLLRGHAYSRQVEGQPLSLVVGELEELAPVGLEDHEPFLGAGPNQGIHRGLQMFLVILPELSYRFHASPVLQSSG